MTRGDLVCVTHPGLWAAGVPVGHVCRLLQVAGAGAHIYLVCDKSAAWVDAVRPATLEEIAAYQLANGEGGQL